MPSDYTVAELVAEFLDKCEVEAAFGIVSVHNIPVLDAVARSNRMRFVPTRGEMGATHMADGYTRAADTLGVIVTSTGPGAANTVGGLAEARFALSPLLHITGQTPTNLIGRGMGPVHEIPDQLGIMAAAGKAAYRIRAGSEAFAVLKRAVEDAMTPPCGPVTVEIPIDVQRTVIERPAGPTSTPCPGPSRSARPQWRSTGWWRWRSRRGGRCCGSATVPRTPASRRGSCSISVSARSPAGPGAAWSATATRVTSGR